MEKKKELVADLHALGMGETAAKLYLALVEVGEATLSGAAKRAGLPRTTADYAVRELRNLGAVVEVTHGRHKMLKATPPTTLLDEARSLVSSIAERDGVAAAPKSPFREATVEVLHGPAGFREAWRRLFASGVKEYAILTDAREFLGYMREHDILEEIVAEKVKRGLRSRQITVDSDYARGVVKKDASENRETRLLPSWAPIPCTEIMCEKLAAFILPRREGLVFLIEHAEFGKARLASFDALWGELG
ncbi:MAG TPA: helix-turn-helix domain-containing protein [Candidatus Paceibacterota bacterium]